jgi:hypothetical protein
MAPFLEIVLIVKKGGRPNTPLEMANVQDHKGLEGKPFFGQSIDFKKK